jgi:hypothetical protein
MTGQTEEKMCRGGWATYKIGPVGLAGKGMGMAKDGGALPCWNLGDSLE